MDTSTIALYSAPSALGTVAAYVAYRYGVPAPVVLAAATLLGQGLHVVAGRIQSKRSSSTPAPIGASIAASSSSSSTSKP